MSDLKLPVGTRIKFTKNLIQQATGDFPRITFAHADELGEITGHGAKEGYWVKVDEWPHPFGASPDEFTVVKP